MSVGTAIVGLEGDVQYFKLQEDDTGPDQWYFLNTKK